MTELLMQLKAFLLWALLLDCTEFVESFCGVQRQEKAGSQSVCRTFHGNWCGRVFSSVVRGV